MRYWKRALIVSVLALPAVALLGDEPPNKTTSPGALVKTWPEDPKEQVKPGPIDKDAPQAFKTTKSGLKYRILRKGAKAKPSGTDIVTVRYKGWLSDQTIFGTSYRTKKKNAFPLKRVMQGWTEGMQLLGVGGMIELEVPAKLGYGKRGMKRGKKQLVPPNARLHFIIELFDMEQEIKIM